MYLYEFGVGALQIEFLLLGTTVVLVLNINTCRLDCFSERIHSVVHCLFGLSKSSQNSKLIVSCNSNVMVTVLVCAKQNKIIQHNYNDFRYNFGEKKWRF